MLVGKAGVKVSRCDDVSNKFTEHLVYAKDEYRSTILSATRHLYRQTYDIRSRTSGLVQIVESGSVCPPYL